MILLAMRMYHVSAAADCGGTDTTPPNLSILRVLTTVPAQGFGFPPWSFRSIIPSGTQASGFAADIACQLRKRLGYQAVEFVNDIGANLLADLNAGQAALVISHISITNGIANVVPSSTALAAFIKYNDDTQESLVTTTKSGSTDLTTLCQNQIVTGFIAGQYSDQEILTNFKCNRAGAPASIPLQPFNTIDEALDGLNTGLIGALLINTPSANQILQTNPNGFVLSPVDPKGLTSTQGIGIAVNNACCQLYANVQKAINEMIADGTLQTLATFWGTGTFTAPKAGTIAIPTSCGGAMPIARPTVERNDISEFIFDKYCPCPQGQTIVQAS